MKPLLLLLIPLFCVNMATGTAQTPPSPAPVSADLTQGNNAFAVDLYGQLRKQDGNLFFSPESISTAFAMAFAGARGTTAAEIATTFHFTLPPEKLHPAMSALLTSLNAPHAGYQLRVADALWAEKDFTFLDDFLKLTSTDYGAGFNQVDFKGAPDSARVTINQWVEQKTEGKITNLLAPGSVSPGTRLVLTNAIYFKGDWQTKFNKASTSDQDFHLSASQTVKAPLMHIDTKLGYFKGGTFQAIAIPYKSRELSMIVFLPNDVGGLPALEQALTGADLQQWLGQLMGGTEIILSFPKFKMTQQFELGDTLAKMGMEQAFDKDTADFSGMTGKRDLWISTAVHKAYIDVNEEGTEAAAATGTTMMSFEQAYHPPPIWLKVDHPFPLPHPRQSLRCNSLYGPSHRSNEVMK